MAVAPSRRAPAQPSPARSARVIRLLVWLKTKTMLRQMHGRSRASAIITGLVLLVMLGPVGFGAAFAVGGFALSVSDDAALRLAEVLLYFVYFVWVMGPLMGFQISEMYDISRLFIFPVTHRQILIAAVVGCLSDFWVIFALPTLTVLVLVFSNRTGTGAILAATAMVLFLIHTFALSQAIGISSSALLKSRRYREVVTVVVTLFSLGFYFAWQILARSAFTFNYRNLLHKPLWTWLAAMPPAMAANAMADARAGAILPALTWIIVLACAAAITVWAAAWAVERTWQAGEVLPRQPRRAATNHAEVEVAPSRALATPTWIPRVVAAMASKESAYIVRDPIYRQYALSLIYAVGVGVLLGLKRGTAQVFGGAEHGFVFAWLLFMELALMANCFGADGAAAGQLFLFPCRRREIFLGKNLPMFAILSVVNSAAIVLVAAITDTLPGIWQWVVLTELTLVLTIGVGNITSVLAPYRVQLRNARLRGAAGARGCTYSLVYFGVFLAVGILALPLDAAVFVPGLLVGAQWYALSIPLAVLYALAMYAVTLTIAERLLNGREPDILAKLAAST
ncbi:MAG: hypothetical protein KGJ62_14150 [Armatimonadetes bacterium]|nr:hypothetical protein [Armatimonadota bacterium]MDE2206999.1 hypothetical protein [Armatimonadota bacterium]